MGLELRRAGMLTSILNDIQGKRSTGKRGPVERAELLTKSCDEAEVATSNQGVNLKVAELRAATVVSTRAS